jgi:hypothetical protein
VGAGRKPIASPCQRPHEVPAGTPAVNLVVLRNSLGPGDAKAGKPPYFWALLSNPGRRAEMMKDGWKSVGRLFILAVVLDVVYQVIVLRFVYPGEAIIVAVILAIVPYLILRGLVTRLARNKKIDINSTDKDPGARKAA